MRERAYKVRVDIRVKVTSEQDTSILSLIISYSLLNLGTYNYTYSLNHQYLLFKKRGKEKEKERNIRKCLSKP